MDGSKSIALLLIILVIVGIIYFIPAIVAFRREHPNKWPILLVNLVFGSTVIGWIGSLIWAMNVVHTSKNGSNGGESGLNIFANDVKTVRVTTESETTDYVSKLTQLKALLDQEVISPSEFDALKKKYLAAM